MAISLFALLLYGTSLVLVAHLGPGLAFTSWVSVAFSTVPLASLRFITIGMTTEQRVVFVAHADSGPTGDPPAAADEPPEAQGQDKASVASGAGLTRTPVARGITGTCRG